VTLNDPERRNGRYFIFLPNLVASVPHCIKVVEDVVEKKFTFTISSPDEFPGYLLISLLTPRLPFKKFSMAFD